MKLVSMRLQNFCGMAQAEFSFDDKTIIEAMNGQGKSTFALGYKWCLGFDFNGIYPVLAPSNIRIGTPDKPLVTFVQITIEKDGLLYELKRVSNQKWKVNRDSGISEFIGNECRYYWDSQSDCNASPYKEKTASLFGCSHSDLELVLDIAYFNTDTTKNTWQTRRKFLFEKLDISNAVKNLANDERFDLLRNELLKGTKDEIDIQRSLTSEKSSIKSEQERNLTLIEDKMKQLAVYQAIDFDSLKKQYEKLEAEKDKLLVKSNKDNKNSLVAEYQDELNKAQANYQKERNLILAQERELSSKKFELDSKNIRIQSDIKGLQNDILTYKYEIEQLELEIVQSENTAFLEHSKICSACGQTLPTNKIEELIATFEVNKSKRIARLRLEVENKRIAIQNTTNKANTLTEQLQGLQAQLKQLNETAIDKSNLLELEKQCGFYLNAISNTKMADVKESVADKIEALKNEMSAINKELGKQAILEDIKSAIEMLKSNSLKLTAQEADRLRKQAQLKEYVLQKVALVNDSVNSYFTNGISFNFFRYNGALAASEFENTCECLLNGIPYDKCSNGERIYADIAVNNGIKKILSINAPTFVDNCECLTKPIECDNQLILLKVKDGAKLDNVLRVSSVYTIADCVVKGGN